MQATYCFVKLPCNMRDGDMQHIVWYAMFIKFPINHSARRMTTCDFSTPYRRNHEFRWLHMQKNYMQYHAMHIYMRVNWHMHIYVSILYIFMCTHKNTLYIMCMIYRESGFMANHKKKQKRTNKKTEKFVLPRKRRQKTLIGKISEFFNQPVGDPSATYRTKQQKISSNIFGFLHLKPRFCWYWGSWSTKFQDLLQSVHWSPARFVIRQFQAMKNTWSATFQRFQGLSKVWNWLETSLKTFGTEQKVSFP